MLIQLLSRSSDFPTNIQEEKASQKEPTTGPREKKKKWKYNNGVQIDNYHAGK